MRVTNKMITDRVSRNLSMAARRYLKLQSDASSGRRINQPSDDPLGITKSLSYRSRLSDISQFTLNLSSAKGWLSYSDQALNDINGFITDAKDLAVQLGNDTYDESARTAGATQARELFNQILDAANTQYRNKYIFSGSKTDKAPIQVNATGAIYQGDYQDLYSETEKGSYLKINGFGRDFLTKPVKTLGEDVDLNPGLQDNMWLTELNNGAGVTMGNGQIVINTLNGRYVADISAAKNIHQVLAAINGLAIPNFTASISPNGNSLQFADTSAHHMTATTPLNSLNSGAGISQVPGTFVIRTSDGSLSATVDISAAASVGDVLTTINTALGAAGINNVTASIDVADNKLVLTDTNATAYNLVIEESSSNQTTAASLGIKGEMVGTMQGTDLKPEQIKVEESLAAQSLAKNLGILKETEFSTIIGEDLNPRLTYFTKISSLNNNSGIQLGMIRITNGFDYANIDLSPLNSNPNATISDLVDIINRSGVNVSAYINSDKTGIMVKSKYDDRSLMITEADSGRTAMALGIFGSPDLVGNMMILEQSLSRNRVEEINATQDVFNKALDQLLTNRSSIGSRVTRADSASNRMSSQELQVTSQLSDIEDADMLKVATELATAQTAYQTSLASAAKIMQQSLLDFLR
jgi:flagellar hook-associated protein 3